MFISVELDDFSPTTISPLQRRITDIIVPVDAKGVSVQENRSIGALQ